MRVEKGVEYGDTVNKMDFPYLTKVVKLNVAALAALASAPPPPAPVAEGAVSTDTTIAWEPVKGAVAYVIRWRSTDESNWTDSLRLKEWVFVTGCKRPCSDATKRNLGKVVASLPGVRVDDFVFGVSSVSKDGYESPVASAVPGGAFRPYTPPLPPAQP